MIQAGMSSRPGGGKDASGEDRPLGSENLPSRHEETPSTSSIEVRLVANGEEGEGSGCDSSGPLAERRSSSSIRATSGGVGGISRHLMAVERARALGQKPMGFNAWAGERDRKSGWRQRLKASGIARDEQGRI